jgi:hypothetical protein
MQFSGWKRHQLRAMGSRNRSLAIAGASGNRAPDGIEPASFAAARKDSASKAAQLLNFLAKTAAQSERDLLSPTPVPDFARVTSQSGSNADAELSQFLAQKRRTRPGPANAAAAPSAPAAPSTASPEPLHHIAELIAQATAEPSPGAQADNLLGVLADVLSEQANAEAPPIMHCTQEAALLNAMSSFNLHALEMLPETEDERDDYDGFTAYGGTAAAADQDDEELERSFDCVADLDKWLSGGSELEEAYAQSSINDPFLTPRTLPIALPPVMPSSEFSGFDDVADPETAAVVLDPAEAATKARRFNASHTHRRDSRYKRVLFNKTVMYKPRLTSMRDGTRRERFDNGAELTKDPLGRVVEVRASHGAMVQLRYDEEGQPDSFVRCNSNGGTHSLGERGKHGVVVRDPEGRVRAAGESMAVDPTGCVSVRREDGQFWSLDLVRGVHIERRRLTVADGAAHVLTAIFASDGFRMVTRFQNAQEGRHDNDMGNTSKRFLAEEPSGTFRFYGRDGSVVQFDSEDDLVELRPSNVWQPGSRFVETSWKGYHQAGTAWESVQEYVTNYLLA